MADQPGRGPDERRLHARRVLLLATLTDLRAQHAEIVAASEGANADDEHDPEGATIAFERSQVAALVQQTETEVAAVDAALALGPGRYGVCERCGEPIAPERLAARPATRRCVGCAALR